MNSDESTPNSDKSFLPIILISLSIIVFFLWQLNVISQSRDSLNNNKQKLDEYASNNISKLDDQVAKAKQIESGLEKLVLDLLELAKTDNDAKAIVTKYNIQQQNPPPGAVPSPSSSSSPAK